MGYFSELDFTQREEKAWDNPTTVQQLAYRSNYLNERLADFEEECPHDMMDPGFDRMFYSECSTGVCGDVNTIQGVLQAIRKTDDLLRIAEKEEQREIEEQQRRAEWRNTVWETGETPDYQIVLVGVFFPAEGHSVAA